MDSGRFILKKRKKGEYRFLSQKVNSSHMISVIYTDNIHFYFPYRE